MLEKKKYAIIDLNGEVKFLTFIFNAYHSCLLLHLFVRMNETTPNVKFIHFMVLTFSLDMPFYYQSLST